MEAKKRRPARGGASGITSKTLRGQVSSTARPLPSTPTNTHLLSAVDGVDLPALRTRLVGVRAHLIVRIAEDWPPDDRRFPDSGWSRLLADVQAAIVAVDDQEAGDQP